MDQNELLSSIQLGEKELFIETWYDAEQDSVVTKTSENGHVLEDIQFGLDEDQSDEEKRSTMEERHKDAAEEWQLLSYIHAKVRASKHVQSLNNLGIVLEKRNLLKEAIDCFEDAVALDGGHGQSALNLAHARVQAGFYDQAVVTLQEALAQSPQYPDLHFGLGVALLKKEDFEESAKAFKQALALNENYDAAHFALARLYLAARNSDPESELADKEEILSHLDRAMEINAYFDRPILQEAREKIGEEAMESALELFDQIDYTRQDRGEGHFDEEFYLRYMFGGKGKDEALLNQYVDRLEREVEIYPNHPDLHNKLGVAYLIHCRNTFMKAMEAFRAALKINPSYKSAMRNLKLAENEGKGFIILLRALLK